MANVSKMSATNAPEAAPGHAASAFFQVLPPEIRLNIYKKASQGARVHAMLFGVDDPSDGSKRYLVRFRHVKQFGHTKHFDLLRTCRKIYDEALPTYWSEAVLNLVQRHRIAGAPAEPFNWLVDRDYTADHYSYHLCNSLPEVVKANVKHVRGMMLPPLHDRFVKENPELTPTAMLSGFKSLATCDISQTMLRYPQVSHSTTYIFRSTIEHDSGTSSEGDSENHLTDSLTRDRGRFKTFLDQVRYEPKDFVRKICGIDATGGVVFLAKEKLYIDTVRLAPPGLSDAMLAFSLGHVDRMPDIPETPVIRSQTLIQFLNLSAGIFWEADPEKVTDEEGFDMVVRGGPEFEVPDGQTG